MELTSQELSELYSKIENKSDKEIECLINVGSNFILSGLGGSTFSAVANTPIVGRIIPGNCETSASKALSQICRDYAAKFSSEIRAILQNNEQKTKFILNIIQLLVPAIAQQYSGIPAMALVGSITLLCRQGIENFIK